MPSQQGVHGFCSAAFALERARLSISISRGLCRQLSVPPRRSGGVFERGASGHVASRSEAAMQIAPAVAAHLRAHRNFHEPLTALKAGTESTERDVLLNVCDASSPPPPAAELRTPSAPQGSQPKLNRAACPACSHRPLNEAMFRQNDTSTPLYAEVSSTARAAAVGERGKV